MYRVVWVPISIEEKLEYSSDFISLEEALILAHIRAEEGFCPVYIEDLETGRIVEDV